MRLGRTLRDRLLLATAVLAFGAAAAAYGTDLLRRAELGSVDVRFAARGDQPAPRDVVFVAIDDVTFEELEERWPFRRGLHARLIDRLRRAGAAVVGYDVQFTEPSDDPADDNALIEAVRRARNVVLASTEVTPDGETRIFGGGEGLEYSRGIPAFSAFPNDPGRVVRRMVIALRGLDSFPVALAEQLTGRPVAAPGRDRDAWVDYAGPPGRIETVSFSRALRGKVPAGVFRDKVVIVGASAPTLQDLHPTSTTGDEAMPGPEIHANAVHTVLEDFPLREAPGWLDLVLVGLLAAVTPLAALRLGRWKVVAISLSALALFGVGAQAAFAGGAIVAVVSPALGWALGAVGAISVGALTAAFERQRTRDLFARFVPESVVDDVLESADGLRLGGVRRVGTVMFSDLRGFTSFSETLPPDDVIAILNRYLTEMSDAILDEGGTLVAYMGDGIMAVFGAPLEQDDHADRALRAAREMLRRMEAFNAWARHQGLGDGFKMGIGLNSGPVMSGHVGSERRLEYTAIGDTTNTAARLEGMTKGTPHQLFVAQSTIDLLQTRPDDLDLAGDFEVRGRRAKIRLWAPAVAAEQPAALRGTGILESATGTPETP